MPISVTIYFCLVYFYVAMQCLYIAMYNCNQELASYMIKVAFKKRFYVAENKTAATKN